MATTSSSSSTTGVAAAAVALPPPPSSAGASSGGGGNGGVPFSASSMPASSSSSSSSATLPSAPASTNAAFAINQHSILPQQQQMMQQQSLTPMQQQQQVVQQQQQQQQQHLMAAMMMAGSGAIGQNPAGASLPMNVQLGANPQQLFLQQQQQLLQKQQQQQQLQQQSQHQGPPQQQHQIQMQQVHQQHQLQLQLLYQQQQQQLRQQMQPGIAAQSPPPPSGSASPIASLSTPTGPRPPMAGLSGPALSGNPSSLNALRLLQRQQSDLSNLPPHLQQMALLRSMSGSQNGLTSSPSPIPGTTAQLSQQQVYDLMVRQQLLMQNGAGSSTQSLQSQASSSQPSASPALPSSYFNQAAPNHSAQHSKAPGSDNAASQRNSSDTLPPGHQHLQQMNSTASSSQQQLQRQHEQIDKHELHGSWLQQAGVAGQSASLHSRQYSGAERIPPSGEVRQTPPTNERHSQPDLAKFSSSTPTLNSEPLQPPRNAFRKSPLQDGQVSQPAGGIRQEPLPDAEAVLNVYIYDYCVKRGFKDAAKAFAMESDLARFRQDYPHIASTLVDSAETFLMEWWSSFWDLYSSKAPRRSSAADRQILPQVQPNASDSSQSFSTSAAAGNSNSVTTGQPRASGVASSSFPTSVSPPALPSDYSSFSGDNSQLLQYRLMNRQFLLQAVQQHGLQGREPNSLTPEEKDKITQTVYELQHRHRAQAQFFADSQRRMDQSRQQAQEQQEHFSDSPLPSHGSMRPTSKRDDQVDLSSPAPTGNARHHSSSLEISEQQQDGKASFAGKWSENSQGSRSESDAAKLMNGDSGPQRGGQDQSAKKVMQNNGGMVAPVGWENLSVAQRQRYLLQRQLLLQQQSLQQQRGWLSQQQSSDGGVVVGQLARRMSATDSGELDLGGLAPAVGAPPETTFLNGQSQESAVRALLQERVALQQQALRNQQASASSPFANVNQTNSPSTSAGRINNSTHYPKDKSLRASPGASAASSNLAPADAAITDLGEQPVQDSLGMANGPSSTSKPPSGTFAVPARPSRKRKLSGSGESLILADVKVDKSSADTTGNGEAAAPTKTPGTKASRTRKSAATHKSSTSSPSSPSPYLPTAVRPNPALKPNAQVDGGPSPPISEPMDVSGATALNGTSLPGAYSQYSPATGAVQSSPSPATSTNQVTTLPNGAPTPMNPDPLSASLIMQQQSRMMYQDHLLMMTRRQQSQQLQQQQQLQQSQHQAMGGIGSGGPSVDAVSDKLGAPSPLTGAVVPGGKDNPNGTVDPPGRPPSQPQSQAPALTSPHLRPQSGNGTSDPKVSPNQLPLSSPANSGTGPNASVDGGVAAAAAAAGAQAGGANNSGAAGGADATAGGVGGGDGGAGSAEYMTLDEFLSMDDLGEDWMVGGEGADGGSTDSVFGGVGVVGGTGGGVVGGGAGQAADVVTRAGT